MVKMVRLCSLFLFLLTSVITTASTLDGGIKVHGCVHGDDGEPLIGATVCVIHGSTNTAGAITNIDGYYSIEVHHPNSFLEFSYIGYVKQRVAIGDKRRIDVKLISDNRQLDEVLVTGYETISRERATGSFAKVDSEQLKRKRPNTLSSLLEGEIAGYSQGLVRGVSSMNGMTTPLYVIDGIPVENTRYDSSGALVESLPDLNMDDIESITILKDAAATSIYGARAANGVVVIVTRKAAKGKTEVNFSMNMAFTPYSYYTGNIADAATIVGIEREWAASNPNLVGDGAASYASSVLRNAVYNSQGIRTLLRQYAGQISSSEANTILNNLASRGHQYYDQVEEYGKENPLSQQYNLNIGKNTDRNNFYMSLNYRNNQLEDKYNKNKTIGVNITNRVSLFKWLDVDMGTYLNYTDIKRQNYSLLSPGFTFLPYDNLMNADGSFYTNRASDRLGESTLMAIDQYSLYNMDITPLDELHNNIGQSKNFNSRVYAKLNITFADWLKYSAMFQYEYGTDKFERMYDKSSYYVRNKANSFATDNGMGGATYNLPYGNILSSEYQYARGYNFRQQLDFNKNIGNHAITALAGMEIRENKIEFASNSLYGYDPEMLTFTMIDQAAMSNISTILGYSSLNSRDVAYNREITNRFVSVYGNAGYSYKGLYSVTGSLRWDRSNLWGTNSKYQNKPIWSVGASWNLSEEEFFKPSWINRLKLRFSHGIGGNIAKDAAPYMTAYYNPNYNVGGLSGVVASRPNPQLSWEKTITTNVGVDFAFFDNRFIGSFEYYNKEGKDLLANTMGVPTEGFGYSTYKVNNGEMRNRGFEMTLSYDIIRKRDWNWSVSGLVGYNKNKVTYVNIEAPVSYLMLDYPEAYPRIGNPYNAIYGYKWAGLSEAGMPQVYDETGEMTVYQPTELDAIVYLGSLTPVYSGSISSMLRYKGFDLSLMLVYEGGHKVRNTFLPFLSSSWSSAAGGYITSLGSVNSSISNRWREPGDEQYTDIPRIVFAESSDYLYDSETIYRNASINVYDASNIRLSNISLAYNFAKEYTRKIFVEGARLQFNIENVVTWTKSKEAKYMLGGYAKPTYVWSVYLNF